MVLPATAPNLVHHQSVKTCNCTQSQETRFLNHMAGNSFESANMQRIYGNQEHLLSAMNRTHTVHTDEV